MDHQYGNHGTRNIYSNYNQMRVYAEYSPNQPKELYLIDLSIEESRNSEDSREVLAVSVSEFYQSIAVQLYQPSLIRWLSLLYVYKNIGNCFCNT